MMDLDMFIELTKPCEPLKSLIKPQVKNDIPNHASFSGLCLLGGSGGGGPMSHDAPPVRPGAAGGGGVSGGIGRKFSLCVGCGGPIHDQFILRVAPNLEWHAACLKCCECQMFLDETHTCFVREGKTYCKKDYVRWGDNSLINYNSSFSKK